MSGRAQGTGTQRDTAAVVSAQGAYRIVLVLLAVWTFFAGAALLTQGVSAIGLSGGGAAERVVGAHMLLLAPIYGLLAWRRNEYRLLVWVPYAAQLAIVVPSLWEFTFGLVFVVSSIFLVLLVYLWVSSGSPTRYIDWGDDTEEDEDDEEAEEEPYASSERERSRRYRRTP
jgi:hypothetical protein